jgi:hypothetical protein
VRRLEQASRHGSLFHLWFHPHNLLADPERALYGLERILQRASDLRAEGRIHNLTMGELARELEARRSDPADVPVLDDTR